MSTVKQWRAAVIAAGFASALLFTGCGGGDGGTVTIVSPGSLETRSYTFSPNTGGQTGVSFVSAGDYTFQHENGTVEQGTYQATRDGNTWTVTLISTAGGQQIYSLDFSSATAGSFVLRREAETDRTGTFTARSATIPAGDAAPSTTSGDPGATTTDPGGSTTTDPGGSTTTDPGGSTTTDPGGSTTTDPGTSTTGPGGGGGVTPSGDYTGNAPVSIAGRIMVGTRTFSSTGSSGQTHVYTFGNGTFHDSDPPEESDGTFTYSANNSAATLNLIYTSPADFSGDRHTMTMTFSQKDRGNFESTYTRGDGTTITINGTFEIEPIP